MPNPTRSPRVTEPDRGTRPGRSRGRRKAGLIPVALATALTLILGGASVARAVTATPLDAHADLEFSLDGSTWSDAPDLVLGSWGCDLVGGPALSDPVGAISGTPEVDPCSMSPGESIDRTYHVRNATGTGRTGRYAVGIGEFLVSGEAEFDVSSTITGSVGADSQTVTLYGADTPQAADSPARGSTVAALDLAPGQTARVVDEVSVPLDAANYAQRQSVSPMIWVSFSDIGVVDTDGDGLPDLVEDQLGTDPTDPLNRLPDGTVGQRFGPEPFLPLSPEGTGLVVDLSTLPPGLRLEDGALVGTPTRAGTYDVEFTVTMPDGATYTSTRRVVIQPRSGGGSSDLPGFIWPVVVVGVIGVIIGPGLGSLGGSIGG
ncbi:MAG: thrombospondin type 3 repeat-containing protein, partial [Dietzia sp.]